MGFKYLCDVLKLTSLFTGLLIPWSQTLHVPVLARQSKYNKVQLKTEGSIFISYGITYIPSFCEVHDVVVGALVNVKIP